MIGQRWRFAVLGLVLWGWGSAAQAGSTTWAESLFSERGIDFGPVPRGAKVRHSFVMTNRLSETVNVVDVRTSCGCTTGRSSATAVPAGGSAVIEAEMDTRSFVGVKATTLTVMLMTASGNQGEVKFGVQSNILPDVVLNPGSADFGAVSKGQTAERVITIERLGKPDWQFTKMIASDELCRVATAELAQTYRTAEGVGYSLKIQIKPDAPAGFLREEIRLLSNDNETQSVPVLVTAQIQGGLTVSPAALSLGQIAPGQPVEGRFLIRGSRPFTIQEIEGNGEGFHLAAADQEPKAIQIVTLVFKPEESASRGDLKRAFRVTTSLPDEAPVDLSASLRLAP